MRNLLTLSAAASVLALGLSSHQAAALFPITRTVSQDGVALKVQQSGESAGPGAGKTEDRGKDGARGGDGAAKGGGPAAKQGGEDRGTGMRSGEKGARGDGARSPQRSNVDVDVNRERRGQRGDRRTRVDIDTDRGRRARGRDVDINVRGYGYSPAGCQEILRRYRQCMAR
jgi:hypothetical protein